jgi:hypothetical protein
MKQPTQAQVVQVVKTFNDMVILHSKRDRLLLEYMSHPEASANELMRIQGGLVKSRKYMVDMRFHIEKHLGRYFTYRMALAQYP